MKGIALAAVVAACGAPTVREAPPAPRTEASEAATRDRVLADLRERIQREPLAVLRELGVADAQFEPLAKQLYMDWRRSHPEPTPAAATPVPSAPSVVTENGVQVLFVEHPFFCFDATHDIHMCASALATCEALRNGLNPTSTCDAAQAAACFLTRNAVSGQSAGWCYSTLKDCRSGRSVWDDADDRVSGSDCIIMRER